MELKLPDSNGQLQRYRLSGHCTTQQAYAASSSRVVLSACHVVANPLFSSAESARDAIDWQATLKFRRHIAELGLGIAEAMDTAQRGMGLDWPDALELIRRTQEELPNALIFNGCGTDQLEPRSAASLDDVVRAYAEQVQSVQQTGARIILMASRALARIARSGDDYMKVYERVLQECDKPVILHWLGDMFDPALHGYWGSNTFETAMHTCLDVINHNVDKIDGIKISLLDKNKEIHMRRLLPPEVRMYTGDDFNYPELIAGDSEGYSDALLGVFDPLAPLAAKALHKLDADDTQGFRDILDPTVELARHIFQAPTQYYKTGVVFLAWLNGHQDHFIMLGGAQSMRSLPHLAELLRLADGCGLLSNPDLAARRMCSLLSLYGID